MTTMQFYVVAIPSILIIFGSLHLNGRLTQLKLNTNRQLDRIDHRLISIEADHKQLLTVTGRLNGRAKQVSRS
jgi:hypothetical protein